MSTESGVEALVRFARLAAEAGTRHAVLPLLAEALVAHVGADAVAVLEIQQTGRASLVPSPHLPKELEGLAIEPELIGEELGEKLLKVCGGRFARVSSRPLVSGGGLFGSVTMFFGAQRTEIGLSLAEGLVDLAAIALESQAQIQTLARSHAELRASQDALMRTEKLRALGQMAAGVSHDLKNILNPLSLHMQLVGRAIDQKDTVAAKESLVEMKQVLTRGVQTIERLRAYSRQSPESPAQDIDLNRLVHEASEIAKPRMAARGGRVARFREELGTPPRIRGRSGDIVSALVNIIVNAIDAMDQGGTITLRTGEGEDTSWVEVRDEGPGMAPEIEARVFEPFFTTKGDEGTGLGLAMVYACMQRHGGSVKLETAIGKGTSFTLLFPRPPSAA